MTEPTFNRALLDFIDASPTPFHATRQLAVMLDDAGFERLEESHSWHLDRGRYYVIRNDSSIIGFRLAEDPASGGLRMVGAHTDSPCLKLKPNSAFEAFGYRQLGVEVYGGVLLNPWFDRDLSLAGRVTLRTRDGTDNYLIDWGSPIAIIPSLAIHLDREANKTRSINAQTYLPAIIATATKELELDAMIRGKLRDDGHKISDDGVLDFELSLYPVEQCNLVGIDQEFIAGARLDNLLSCFVATRALIDSDGARNQLVVCNDHEEVGSGSAAGARGTFLRDVLARICPEAEQRIRALAHSMLVSTDNAHGIHPNFADKHDERHGPLLNAGPVIKVNQNQSYATNSETAAIFKFAAQQAGINTQSFVTRSDMGCGSTIGPLTATALGVRTVDVGVPTFAMHSIRELAGAADAADLYAALCHFNSLESVSASP